MRIATWNVNSVKARLPLILAWLENRQPDVLLLQEIKCETAAFPTQAFAENGYHGVVVGQKAYNGVAVLARTPLILIPRATALPPAPENPAGPPDPDDLQARYAEVTVAADPAGPGIRIASLYLPNGNPVTDDDGTPSHKYRYKLAWMARLERHARTLLTCGEPVALGGDYNVIPAPADVYDPVGWQDDALFRLPSRQAYRRILHQGYTDAFRALHPDQPRAYTFWDYQAGCWPQDRGLRIDHMLLSPAAADRLHSAVIDRDPRGQEKASDHTPLVVELDSVP